MAEVIGVTSHVITIDENGEENAQFVGVPTHVWLGDKFDGSGESHVYISYEIAEPGGATRAGQNHGEADLEPGDLYAVVVDSIGYTEYVGDR